MTTTTSSISAVVNNDRVSRPEGPREPRGKGTVAKETKNGQGPLHARKITLSVGAAAFTAGAAAGTGTGGAAGARAAAVAAEAASAPISAAPKTARSTGGADAPAWPTTRISFFFFFCFFFWPP